MRWRRGAAFAYDPHDWYEVGFTNAMNAMLFGADGCRQEHDSVRDDAAQSRARRSQDHRHRRQEGLGRATRTPTAAASFASIAIPRSTSWKCQRERTRRRPRKVRFRAARSLVSLAAERDLTDREVWALERAVHDLAGPAPLLEDLLRIVTAGAGADDVESAMLRDAGVTMIPALSRLTSPRGGFGPLLNRQSTVSFDAEAELFVVSLGDLVLADELRTAALIAVASWVDAAVTGNTQRRLLVLDEAWQLLKQPQAAIAHAERLKLARANNLANLLILHRPGDLASFGLPGSAHREAVRSVFGLSDTIAIGRLDHADAADLARMLNLNGEEARLISAHPTGRFLWSVHTAAQGRRSWVVQTQRTPWEAELWNTKAVAQ